MLALVCRGGSGVGQRGGRRFLISICTLAKTYYNIPSIITGTHTGRAEAAQTRMNTPSKLNPTTIGKALSKWVDKILYTIGEPIAVFFIFVAVVALLFGIGFFVNNTLGPVGCNHAAAEIGFSYRWDIWSGCMIEVQDGQWIPLDNYRWVENK